MFTILNRLRGTWAIFSKINAIVLIALFGTLFSLLPIGALDNVSTIYTALGLVVNDWVLIFTVPVLIGLLYIGGESMGWGEWIGGIIYNDGRVSAKHNGAGNGIEWLATRFTTLYSSEYHILALFIRGLYWWIPTLVPLLLVMPATPVLLAMVGLGIGFPVSVLIGTKYYKHINATEAWVKAEVIYGCFQDVALFTLIYLLYINS